MTLDRPALQRPLWMDIILGIGAAWDPLPAKHRQTFCRDDQAAFSADIAKLVRDRLAVEHTLVPAAPGHAEHTRRLQNVHGQTSSALAQAD